MVVLFTLGAALAAVVLVVLTYSLTRGSLLNQRQESSRTQFFANARQVQAALRSEDPDFGVLLESLPSLAGSRPIVWTGPNTWRAPSLTPDALPSALVQATTKPTGNTGSFEMRYRLDGTALLALGLLLQPDEISQLMQVAYFEVVPLGEIESTLTSLRTILLVGAAFTIMLGAGIGVFTSRRLLQPLTDISTASAAIAKGRFKTRVARNKDPDLDKIAQSFNDMANALESRIERDSRFASDVSHELRSPLQTLRSSIEVLLRRRHELSEHAATALDLLAGDVNRFERLVKDLLEISQTDSGDGSFHLTLVNISKLLRHSVAAIDSENLDRLSLDVTPEAEKALVLGDKRHLVQILDNLLRNAEKYGDGDIAVEMSVNTPDTGGARAAKSGGAVLGDTVLIAIEDNGPGVTPSERELVFERFTRGSAARQRDPDGGAGLGLALVYEHARRHGGTAHIENKTNGTRGARFVVQLPLSGPEAVSNG